MDGLDLKIFQEELIRDYALWPVYSPSGELNKTFCNIGARSVAQFLGCHEFDDLDLTADLMYQIMSDNMNKSWCKCTGNNAQQWAYKGRLAFAALPSWILKENHGHIASITQDSLEGSASLGHAVPSVANIGKGDPSEDFQEKTDGTKTKPNWICRSSQAFPVITGECHYFIWRGRV